MKSLKQIFNIANNKFLKKEKELIYSDVAERCLCAALKSYIEKEISKDVRYKDYNVDVEYNRNAGHVKTIRNDELKVISIICDLIVHSRGHKEEQDNLIAVEMKKAYRPQEEKDSDRMRLRALTKPKDTEEVWRVDGKAFPKYVCGYRLGVYYEIDIEEKEIYIEYYQNGKMTESYTKKIEREKRRLPE